MPLTPDFRWFNRRSLPEIIQTEAAECGLACIAMVANYWGHKVDMLNMRRRFSVSLKGTTLRTLIAVSSQLSLDARALRVEPQQFTQLRLPCILHWNFTHFVVLKQVSRDWVILHDPAVGERKIRFEELSKNFTGVALELRPGANFEKKEELNKFSLRSLMGRVVGLRRGTLKLIGLGAVLQVCTFAVPFYLQWVVDDALVSGDRDLITVLGVAFLTVVAIQAVVTYIRAWLTTVLATDLNFQWLGNTFSHLMRLPIFFFERRHVGDIISRFSSIQVIQKSLTTQFAEGVIDGLLVMATVLVMLLYSIKLTVIALTSVGIYAFMRIITLKPIRVASAEQVIHAARQQTYFLETVRGMQSIRLFNREAQRRMTWLSSLVDQFNADLKISRLTITNQTANVLVFNCERVVVVWLAALAVLKGDLTIGMLFAFISLQDQFCQRAASLVDKLNELRILQVHGNRIADILLSDVEDQEGELSTHTKLAYSISLRDVCFRYSDMEPYVIDSLSAHIPEGQCVAITGSSGCGKTTLAKVILGLLECTSGDVLVGGLPIKKVGLEKYRSLIGAVMQDDQLFVGSIADNICFFDATPCQEDVIEAAKMAAIHEAILAMPMGYNTLVGDIGTGLSGGQKQRILLARALYKKPSILLLDEATSHLDVESERMVNLAIESITLTRVVIAHRPETIAMADRIITLDQGRIVADSLSESLYTR